MSGEIERRIAAIAARQHAVVTTGQLVEAGLSASAIDRRLRSGRLTALHRGVYLAVPLQLPRTREMAAVLASGAGALLSHLSAVTLWGIPTGTGATKQAVDVSVWRHNRHRPSIRVHRLRQPLPGDEHALLDGIPITSPARTLLDVATVMSPRDLEAAVARAERAGLVTPEALAKLLARHRGHRGARALRTVLEAAGGPALTRSAAEERFLALVREAGLATPRVNSSVGRYEIDFLWPSAALAVEVDGYQYHSSRRSFERDRRRDAELLAAGIVVLRLSWRQITDQPLATVRLLTQALARRGGDRR